MNVGCGSAHVPLVTVRVEPMAAGVPVIFGCAVGLGASPLSAVTGCDVESVLVVSLVAPVATTVLWPPTSAAMSL